MRTAARIIVALVASSVSLSACTKHPPKTPLAIEPADYLFTNAKVYTVNPDQAWAEAVAIRGNRIVYVGDSAGADSFVGEGTVVHDLAGKMVLPGFVSGHDHLIASNWTKAGVSLFGAQSKDEVLARIRDYAEAHPDEEIVFGYGWDRTMLGGIPTATDLDHGMASRHAVAVKNDVVFDPAPDPHVAFRERKALAQLIGARRVDDDQAVLAPVGRDVRLREGRHPRLDLALHGYRFRVKSLESSVNGAACRPCCAD